MIAANKHDIEQTVNYHFVLLGFSSFKKVLEKMSELLNFYRFENIGKSDAREIIYDVTGNVLSDAGIVLSKQFEDGKILFNVRKISLLPGAMKKPSQKLILGELESDEEPKDFSKEITAAIENTFSTPLTMDLDSFVKRTFPKIEIKIRGEKYKIIGGTGFRGLLVHEFATYKDIRTNKKVEKEGVVLQLSSLPEYEKENAKFLDFIARQVKELGLYNASRFEIAHKLLYPKVTEPTEPDEEPPVEE